MKGLLLLSGGIDSPVAGYRMQQLGVDLIAVHFSSEPFTTNEAERKSCVLAEKLGIPTLYVVLHGSCYSLLVKHCTHKYYYILMRRLMLRTAEALAQQEQCDFLVTGENLGQVASQTLSNMATITEAVRIPVLRPLLCNDKQETIALARKIGTYDLSKGPEFCCVLGPKHPATQSTIDVIHTEESSLDICGMIEQSIKHMKCVTVF